MLHVGYLDALADDYAQRGYSVTFLPFTYSAAWLPLVAQTTQSQTVTIDHDSDFVCCAFTRSVHDTAVPPVWDEHPVITGRIILGTAQRALDAEPNILGNVWGVGGRPAWLAKPLVLAAKTTVELRLTSGAGIGDRNVRLSMIGAKAYLRGA